MTRDEALAHERIIDKLLGMTDMPDGYYWSEAKVIDDEWCIVVRFSPHEDEDA